MTTETEDNVTAEARCHALDSKDRGKATSQGKKCNSRSQKKKGNGLSPKTSRGTTVLVTPGFQPS